MTKFLDVRRVGAAIGLGLLVAGCGGQQDAPGAMPPPLVTVETLRAQDLPNIVELPGRIEAVRTAEVRARVDGIVQRRLYEEGVDVREGTPLFQIDPREKQVALQQAQAELQRAVAARNNAAGIAGRYAPLVERRAISAQENDQAQSDLRQADAQVDQARAAVNAAKLQLSYTLVRAPLSGLVGAAEVTEGALVSAAGASLMTRIDQLDPAYATFTESAAHILDMFSQQRSGELSLPSSINSIPVRLILENGAEYGPVGYLDFADQAVNPQTGSQALRARFPNPQRQLLPGQFVRARIEAGITRNAVSVPQRAVQITDNAGAVTVVAADGTASVRPVQLGGLVNGRWAIRAGLKPGERVIVDGWQKAQPGQKVRVRDASAAPAPGAPAAAR